MKGEWIRKPKKSLTIVFVHGILSSGEKCWLHSNGTFWPALILAEQSLDDIGIYNFTYATSIFSGDYSVGDIVDSLKEFIFNLDGVVDNGDVVFVCHSMGGIVVRKLIVQRAIELAEKKVRIGMFLIASPSLGATYASLLKPLARLFRHSQAEVLRFINGNQWLADLDRDFMNLLNRKNLSIIGKELVEDKFVVLRRLLFLRQVVQPFAGAKYFGESLKVPESDHFSIAKPADKDAVQHRLLIKFLSDFADGCIVTEAPSTVTIENQRSDPSAKPTLVAPPYSLLQSDRVIGRKLELTQLDAWISELNGNNKHPCYIIQGIGGMGKSALSWSWFLDSDKVVNLEGRLWWSFYDNNNFSDFVETLYCYVLDLSYQSVQEIIKERKDHILFNQLIQAKGNYVVVLDGLERILQAYDSVDPYHKLDSMEIKLSNGADTIKLKDGRLLLELINARNIKFLISTRLIPSTFIKTANKLMNGVLLMELEGLTDEDAVSLWYSLGMSLEPPEEKRILLRYFNQFANYPLLIKVLAGVVSRSHSYREWKSFKRWLQDNPHLDVFALKLNNVQTQSHILDNALKDLGEATYSILYKMAAFKLNIKYIVLWDLSKKDFNLDESAFQEALDELVGRCLIGWDELTRTYDMHPVIRGVVWTNMAQDSTKEQALHSVEEFISGVIKNEPSGADGNIRNAEMLLVLFGNYISQGKYEAALKILQERLNDLLLSDTYYRYFMECMDLLFPVSGSPKVTSSGVGASAMTECIDEAFKGKYNFARFKGMTHRLNCGNYFCEGLTALAGNEYSKYKFNEEIYMRVLSNRAHEIANGIFIHKDSSINVLAFSLLDLLDRGYLDQALAINKHLPHDLNRDWIEYHIYMRLNDYENTVNRIDKFMYHSPPFLLTKFEVLKDTNYYGILADVTMDRMENVTLEDLENLNSLFERNEMVLLQIQTHLMLSKYYLSQDDLTNARSSANKALALSSRHLVVKREAEAHLVFAEIHHKQNNLTECQANALKAFNLAYDAGGYSDHWILVKAKEKLDQIKATSFNLDIKLYMPDATVKMFQEFEKITGVKLIG